MNIYAHSLAGRPHTDWELLEKHLFEVGVAASANAAPFGAGEWAAILGRCHDLGKASDEFQNYLHASNQSDALDAGVEEGSIKRVNHSTFGARYVAKAIGGIFGQMLAFCVAGHHGGLPNESSSDDATQAGTLRVRLDESIPIPRASDPELALIAPDLPWRPSSQQNVAFELAFFTRMLFSCLVDADRACTEAFCSPEQSEERRQPRPSMDAMRKRVMAHLAELQSGALDTAVNRLRNEVLEQCRVAVTSKPGFFSLQVPTGGGKTLSSLAFALEHAAVHSQRRIVVAIPFTSIIEQTADVYRKALGPLAARALVEHHTNLQPRHDTRANQFGAETWEAPIVVTTNVQLFESLFAYRTTPCRKLHNLARSVIVLDEAQTIPVELLKPTLAALKELVLHYGCSIVLCTATQPALERRSDFELGIENVRPIIPDAVHLFQVLRRVEVRHLEGKQSDEQLSSLLLQEGSALCIVNTRKHASRLYSKIVAGSDAAECFHLSTWMCGDHRRQVLQTVRDRLKEGKLCRLVSTQLVEAGVDLDFPIVYRAETGFDSIAQAAGRCNREGKLRNAEGELAPGCTYVFEAEERPPAGLLLSAADAAKELHSLYPDPLEPAALEAYFRLFYWMKKLEWDKHGVMKEMSIQGARLWFQFREMANKFRMIREEQLPVLVPYTNDSGSDNPVWNKLAGNKVAFLPQREMQPYLVSVKKQAVDQMQDRGFVTEHESGVWILLNRSLYSREKGLDPEATTLDAALWGV